MIFWSHIQVKQTTERKDGMSYQVVIIGGGASGMMAAISALEEAAHFSGGFSDGVGMPIHKKSEGKQGRVLLLESNDRVGKKILATGNGRCNFTHENIAPEAYYSDDENILQSILSGFQAESAVEFFGRLGMLSKNKNGYFYPLTETASTVLDVLRLRLMELGCEIRCNIKIEQVCRGLNGGYRICCVNRESGRKDLLHAENMILATGSMAGGFLQDRQEDPLRLARTLGLKVTPLYPALAKCTCKEDFYKGIAGVRAQVKLSLLEEAGNDSGWEYLREEEGELQLTKEGISGIVVFQLSGDVAQKLAEKRRMMAEINFLPDFPEKDLEAWAKERLRLFPWRSLEDFFLGVLHKKLLYVCLKREGLKPAEPIPERAGGTNTVLRVMKRAMHFTTEITGTADIRQAQACRGGILLSEFQENLECKKLPGVFACGEVLNVDGQCGGYNLHFAWASGYLAGKAAMQRHLARRENEKEESEC